MHIYRCMHAETQDIRTEAQDLRAEAQLKTMISELKLRPSELKLRTSELQPFWHLWGLQERLLAPSASQDPPWTFQENLLESPGVHLGLNLS